MDEHEKPLAVTPLTNKDIQLLIDPLTIFDAVDGIIENIDAEEYTNRLRRTFG